MAGTYALVINQGETFSRVIAILVDSVVLDLTGYTVAAKIRATFDAASGTAITAAVTTAAAGEVTISLTAAQTAALSVTSPGTREASLGFWDLEITTGAVVTRVLQGTVTLSQEATK